MNPASTPPQWLRSRFRRASTLERLETRDVPALVPTPLATPAALANFSSALIDGESRAGSLPKFNPILGQLLGVSFQASATLEGTAQLENAADTPAPLNVAIGGAFTFSPNGLLFPETSFTNATTSTIVPAFDGVLDLEGPGLVTLGNQVLNTSAISDHTLDASTSDLSGFVGDGAFDVTFSPTGHADIADPNGNVLVQTELNAGALVSVIYRYMPYAISGKVYLDGPKTNGLHDPNEPGIPRVTLILTGQTATGDAIAPLTTQTDANGDYLFTGLQAGTYTVSEIQPHGYLDGDETRGNLTPLGNDRGVDLIDQIVIGPANHLAPQNNFGERLPAGGTQTLVSAQVFGIHAEPSRVVFTFSTPLDASRARDLANYRVTTAGPDRRFQTSDDVPIRLRSAAYDPSRRTVTVVTKSRLALNKDYLLFVKGPAGVLLVGQQLIDGFGGRGDYTAIVQRGKQVAFNDTDGDRVTLAASRGGVLTLQRSLDGTLQRLFVLHGSTSGQRLSPRGSTLSASVTKVGSGNGRVVLPTLIAPVPLRLTGKRTSVTIQSIKVDSNLPAAGA